MILIRRWSNSPWPTAACVCIAEERRVETRPTYIVKNSSRGDKRQDGCGAGFNPRSPDFDRSAVTPSARTSDSRHRLSSVATNRRRTLTSDDCGSGDPLSKGSPGGFGRADLPVRSCRTSHVRQRFSILHSAFCVLRSQFIFFYFPRRGRSGRRSRRLRVV